ncbi:MAG TPA: S1 RNA-binding domain-containing protein [Vicinamibacterales bacterium]|nr:S1 RNA-binding domain-containing protein [Vicinamibacterales bacterium]
MSEQEEDFASLFEASATARQFKRGQQVEGHVVAIGPKVAFVNIGGKGEAEIDVAELKDDEGDVEVAVGDRIHAMVVSTSGGIVLSRKGVRNAATHRELEDAFQSGLAVEGKVVQPVKGGYEVRVARERAFCPMSQIDIVRTADPNVHVGKVYAFRVVEYKNGGKDIVLSRRKLLEQQQQAEAAEVRQSIVPGAVLKGRVASVLDFGAFVDVGGGIQGLLHVSEMSWTRITSPSALVAPGDEVTVKVLRVDDATGKISLGLKQLQDDPWAATASGFVVGQVYAGRVTRIADFGAFVEVAPGVEGLAHASTFPPTGHAGGWSTSLKVGDTGAYEVLSVDIAQKRLSLARVEDGSSRAAAAGTPQDAIAPGAILTGKVERHEKFGVFVFLAPGRTALMPLAETGLERDADPKKAFPIGSEVEVVVLDVDQASRRIRVSKKAVAERREQAELREYTSRQQAEPSASIGSLADKLRGALGKQ